MIKDDITPIIKEFEPCDCKDCKKDVYCEYCNTNYRESSDESDDDYYGSDDDDESDDEVDTFTGSPEDPKNYVLQGIDQKTRAAAAKRLHKYFKHQNEKVEKKEETRRQHQLCSLLKYYDLDAQYKGRFSTLEEKIKQQDNEILNFKILIQSLEDNDGKEL